jgi:hypothetical protein
MKKYLIVARDVFYPDAGLENIRHQTDDLETARRMAPRWKEAYDHIEIFSTETNEVVEVIK